MRKIGEKVIIRKDLIEDKKYGEDIIVDDMMQYLGKIAIVTEVFSRGYFINIDPICWTWTDEMFENQTTVSVGLNRKED